MTGNDVDTMSFRRRVPAEIAPYINFELCIEIIQESVDCMFHN